MQINIFQSDKGDCMMIRTPKCNILVDGGMKQSYHDHVAGYLSHLEKDNKVLDLVCVSHIDQDHILGILTMLDDLVAWRVYDYQKNIGNRSARRPKVLRPPEITNIWHNAFHEQIERNSGEIEDILAAFATLYYAYDDEQLIESGDLATSVRQAILLSRRINAKQLNIPLNAQFNNKLALVNKKRFKFKDTRVTILGPYEEDVTELRKEWNAWLKKNSKSLARIRKNASKDEEDLGNNVPILVQFDQADSDIGNRRKVTTPNLASIMFLLEHDGKRILMTGDGHSDEVYKSLQDQKLLRVNGTYHVDMLKIFHHGSEFNMTPEFCKLVTADHYVFCGNGAHHNPDQRIVSIILDSRLSNGANKAITNQVDNPFNFWFSSSSLVTTGDNQSHMKKVERQVKAAMKKSSGKLVAHFMAKKNDYLKLVL